MADNDIVSIGVSIDTTQAVSGAANLDKLTASATATEGALTGASAAAGAGSADYNALSAAIAKAAAAQYGLSQASADALKVSIAGDTLRNSSTNAILAAEKAKQDAIKATAAAQLAAAVEAASIAKQQEAEYAAAYAEASAINKSMVASEAEKAGAIVESNLQLSLSSFQVREAFRITKDAITGNYDRMAGSAASFAIASNASFLAILGPIAAVVAIVGGLIAAFQLYQNSVSQLQETTYGLGTATGLTANQLGDLAAKTATAADISITSSEKQEQSLIRFGVTNADVFTQIQDHLKDYEAATGEKAPAALEELAKAFADPTQGAQTLSEKIGGIDGPTKDLIRTLQEQGDTLGADTLLMKALAEQTQGAADKATGLGKAFSDAAAKVSDFFHNLGQGLSADKSPTGIAQYYSGFGSTPALDQQKSKDDDNQRAAAANQLNAQNTALSLAAADALDKLAPKQKEINDLKNQEILINKALDAGEVDPKRAQDAINAANQKIAELQKPQHIAATPAQRYGVTADKTEDQAQNTLKEAQAYLQSSAAGLQYEARITALKDAIDKKIPSDEQARFIQASLNEEVAKASLAADKQTASLRDQTQEQNKLTAEVEAGTITSTEAAQALAKENALRPIAAALAAAQGDAAKKAAQDAYTAQAQAIDQNYQGKLIEQLAAANENYQDQNNLIQFRIGLLGESNKAQAVAIAQEQERQALEKQQRGLSGTPQGQQAVASAGANAGANSDLASLKSNVPTITDQVQALTGQLSALDAQYKNGELSLGNYNAQLLKVKSQFADLKAESTHSFGDIIQASLLKLNATGKTTTQQLTENFSQFFEKLEDGFANSIGAAVVQSKNLGQALSSVAQSAAQELISALVKMGEQQLINLAIGTSAQTASTAATLAAQTALTPILSANALYASIISFGAADAAGATALAAALASAQAVGLTGLALADGGPVSGPGGARDDKVPVWASAGEYMINAKAAAQNRPILDAINSGKSLDGLHYANGGPVGNSNYPTASNNNGQSITHFDFSGANFSGTNPDAIKAVIRQVVSQEYEPRITKNAVQTAIQTQQTINKHQRLNDRRPGR